MFQSAFAESVLGSSSSSSSSPVKDAHTAQSSVTTTAPAASSSSSSASSSSSISIRKRKRSSPDSPPSLFAPSSSLEDLTAKRVKPSAAALKSNWRLSAPLTPEQAQQAAAASGVECPSHVQPKIGQGAGCSHPSVLALAYRVSPHTQDTSASQLVISVDDTPFVTMYCMLAAVYGAVYRVPPQLLPDLIVIANKYLLTELKERCARVLGLLLGESTCIPLLQLADMCHTDGLKRCCLQFIKDHDIALNNPQAMEQLVKSDAKLASEVMLAFASDLSALRRSRQTQNMNLDMHSVRRLARML